MQLSFEETMRGTLRDATGQDHPAAFEVSARGEGKGFFRLEGLVRAAPWAGEAKATGSLHISPRLEFLRYRVRFAGAGGEWELRGEKTPSVWSPLRSMTELPTTLVDPSGAEVAHGTLAFALRDLPQFLSSWRPLRRRRSP